MATKPFKYQEPFPLGKDTTEYYLLTKDGVSVETCHGKEVLVVEPEALTHLANTATRDVAFMLRREHNEMVAKILHDPEASENDKYVALTMLRNAEVACKGQLPFCQDTGTAIIVGKKGQQVWTGGGDEEALSLGVYKTYTEENLRYSQNAPLDMYKEVNTGCNLPAQIDLYAVDGMEYKALLSHLRKNGEQIKESIRNQTYKPMPVKRVEIPKEDGSKRKLGIPTVTDRTIQQAVAQVLTPIYEEKFHDNSYGFRPQKSAQQAVLKAVEYMNEECNWIVDIDLEKFFDTVNHDKLISILNKEIKDGKILSLIRKLLVSGVMVGTQVKETEMGTPQSLSLTCKYYAK